MGATAVSSAPVAAGGAAKAGAPTDADADADADVPVVPGERIEDLPTYTAAEVAAHAGCAGSASGGGDGSTAPAATTVWVTYGAGVYDVTEFIACHPGGDILLRAAGSSVEPYWDMYAQHRQEYVYEVLEEMRVGNLAPADVAANAAARAAEQRPDAYANEPARWDGLQVRSAAPFNAEPPPAVLVASYITPNHAFYVRNHLPVPPVATGDGTDFQLSVAVPAVVAGAPSSAASASVGRSCVHTLSLADVQALPAVTITAAIQCAGNRRTEMSGHRPVKGGAWDVCAISNATWTGARLTDVLASLGVPDASALAAAGVRHVVFEGADADAEGGTYGASIPLDVLAAGDVLLAWAMNGEPLPADHGAPLRVVAPGIVGARNVKWVKSIALSDEESHSHWQRRDYKGFCPSVCLEDADYDASPSIQELPITSAIGDVAVAPNGQSVTARGYAYAGGGRPVVRVDVSADGGKTWVAASLTGADGSPPSAARGGRVRDYGWTLWSATLPLPSGVGDAELVVKAVDSSYNVQPEGLAGVWNVRGVLNNAWHRVRVGGEGDE